MDHEIKSKSIVLLKIFAANDIIWLIFRLKDRGKGLREEIDKAEREFFSSFVLTEIL